MFYISNKYNYSIENPGLSEYKLLIASSLLLLFAINKLHSRISGYSLIERLYSLLNRATFSFTILLFTTKKNCTSIGSPYILSLTTK